MADKNEKHSSDSVSSLLERAPELYAIVDDASPPGLPKYLRVCRMFEEEISAGRIGPGDRLPSELELTQVLPISLGTVQKSLQELASRGIILREQGKGTFVTDARVDESKLWHLRFLRDDGSLAQVYVAVQAVGSINYQGPWTEFIGAHPFYIEIKRTMSIDRKFTVASSFYVAGPPFWELLTIPADEFDSTSLRGTLGTKRFDAATLKAVEHFAIRPIADEIANTIGVAPQTNVMVCDVVGFGIKNAPVYFQRYWIPPNPYRLEAGATIPRTDG